MFLDKLDNPYIYLFLGVYLSIATYFDIKYLKIPDKLSIVFFFLRFIFIPILGFSVYNILGFFFGFFIFLIPAMMMNKPMGGDIKTFSIIGLYLGLEKSVMFLIILIILSLIFMLIKKYVFKNIKDTPLAPFFLTSTILLMILQMTTSISLPI